jgi:hypothetical protein
MQIIDSKRAWDLRRLINIVRPHLVVIAVMLAGWGYGSGLRGQASFHKGTTAGSAGQTLDLSVEKLPPHFEGQSIPLIWQSLLHLNLRKSDYETEAQYQSRIERLGATKIVGNVPLNGMIAMVIVCDYPDPDLQCDQYDAEQQVMSVESPIDEYFLVREDAGPRRPGGIAQNGFGARFSMVKQDMTRYFVSAGVPKWYAAQTMDALRPQINRRVELSMAPEEAQRARGHIREILIGRVTAPFLVESEQSIEAAKPSYPIETRITLHTFHMEIDQVWFFNFITGTIYRKLAADTAH